MPKTKYFSILYDSIVLSDGGWLHDFDAIAI
jgi:hypothetical protein